MLAADDSEDPELVPQLRLTAQVAQLLPVLVNIYLGHFPDHDHLSNLHPQVGSLLDRHGPDANTRGPEHSCARSWGSWSGVCEGPVSPSMMTEAWPTPTAEAWQVKSSIALQAVRALRWLNNLTRASPEFLSSAAQSSQDTAAAYQAAGESLLQPLDCCLAGEHAVL